MRSESIRDEKGIRDCAIVYTKLIDRAFVPFVKTIFQMTPKLSRFVEILRKIIDSDSVFHDLVLHWFLKVYILYFPVS